MIQPGEIYLADFPGAGPHPVIVVSRESLNRGNSVVVVVCTSARFALRSTLPNCIPFRAGQFGFTRDCVAQCETILSLDQDQLDLETGQQGLLSEKAFRDVVKAIGNVIGSDCEPR